MSDNDDEDEEYAPAFAKPPSNHPHLNAESERYNNEGSGGGGGGGTVVALPQPEPEPDLMAFDNSQSQATDGDLIVFSPPQPGRKTKSFPENHQHHQFLPTTVALPPPSKATTQSFVNMTTTTTTTTNNKNNHASPTRTWTEPQSLDSLVSEAKSAAVSCNTKSPVRSTQSSPAAMETTAAVATAATPSASAAALSQRASPWRSTIAAAATTTTTTHPSAVPSATTTTAKATTTAAAATVAAAAAVAAATPNKSKNGSNTLPTTNASSSKAKISEQQQQQQDERPQQQQQQPQNPPASHNNSNDTERATGATQDPGKNSKQQQQLEKIKQLEQELAEAKATIFSMKQQGEEQAQVSDTLTKWQTEEKAKLDESIRSATAAAAVVEQERKLLQSKMQELETSAQKESDSLRNRLTERETIVKQQESKIESYEARIKELEALNQSQAGDAESNIANMAQMQSALENQMTATETALEENRKALERINRLEAVMKEQNEELHKLENQLVEEREINCSLRVERDKAVEDRDEEERKQHAMTTRLNAAKKKEAVKADLAEQLEDEVKTLRADLKASKKTVQELVSAKDTLERKFNDLQTSSEERIKHVETLLADERQLNEERKRKMRLFVESKAEEIRQLKMDIDGLQTELDQTNRSLKETHNRWKTQHAQWVQAQTRNRELQRDLNRIKKDSENLHKVGDTLEMKLSKSANETEEHKNKRLAAKHELMTVLRTLEAERELGSKLKDSIKFTFTPKALSQQQLLKEGLEDLEAQLQRLSTRLGRPLPPRPDGSSINEATDTSEHESDGFNGGDDTNASPGGGGGSHGSRSEAEVRRLIGKLEYETQRTSQCIMAFSASIERLSAILNASGDRTCFSALGEILLTGGMNSSPAARAALTASSAAGAGGGTQRPLNAIRSQQLFPPSPIAEEEFGE